MEEILLTNLDIIETKGGNVYHGMKKNDPGYKGFSEAYFSTIEPFSIKAWKRHREMTLNIIVPFGKIRFVIYDDRDNSKRVNSFEEIILYKDNYKRLTIPPGLWIGFQGLDDQTSILLNIANMKHSKSEIDRKPLNDIKYEWGIQS